MTSLKLGGYVDANFKLDGKAQKRVRIPPRRCLAVSWASKKRASPVTSSSEAELVAAVSAAQEAVYLETPPARAQAPTNGAYTIVH